MICLASYSEQYRQVKLGSNAAAFQLLFVCAWEQIELCGEFTLQEQVV